MASIVVIGFLLVAIITIVLAVQYERREWNNGICRKNGLPWRCFDTDSQGGRGYEAGYEICWITYPVDEHTIRPELIIVKDERPL